MNNNKNNNKLNLGAMSVDEMWQLHEDLGRALSVRLTTEKRQLEKRLAQLRRENEIRRSETDGGQASKGARERRKYPRVLPKYRNPDESSETWSGRGKQPRWLVAALKSGHTIEEFLISGAAANKNAGRRKRAQAA
jgi:DNA-binding protein H-NS